MKSHSFIPYTGTSYDRAEMIERSNNFYSYMDKRRSLRDFSDREVPEEVIQNILMTASSAPSGAHKQPWTFCAISNPDLKKQIRAAAEEEEKINYSGRMSEEWLNDLAQFDTDWQKEFLDVAPWLIIVFKKSYDLDGEKKKKNYYVNESVGIACGFLLTAIHMAGLVSLTHTPSPMNFLEKILERPKNEKAFLLIPVGYPMEGAQVPDIQRKRLEDISIWKR